MKTNVTINFLKLCNTFQLNIEEIRDLRLFLLADCNSQPFISSQFASQLPSQWTMTGSLFSTPYMCHALTLSSLLVLFLPMFPFISHLLKVLSKHAADKSPCKTLHRFSIISSKLCWSPCKVSKDALFAQQRSITFEGTALASKLRMQSCLAQRAPPFYPRCSVSAKPHRKAILLHQHHA